MDNTLVVIPARGDSKRLPHKNTKLLNGKPLICYSLEVARTVFDDRHICVSTDSSEIKELVEQSGLTVPFLRPAELATDTASSRDVILHAVDYYRNHEGMTVDQIVLLQPTSPFRTAEHLQEALGLFSASVDMVVSVKETKANPYFTLFELNEEGYLTKSKPHHFTRAQDCPAVYELNGSIYVINFKSLAASPITHFQKVIPFRMEDRYSVDIDTEFDWHFAEFTAKYLPAV